MFIAVFIPDDVRVFTDDGVAGWNKNSFKYREINLAADAFLMIVE